jgi:hypothetical protein
MVEVAPRIEPATDQQESAADRYGLRAQRPATVCDKIEPNFGPTLGHPDHS